MLLYAVSFLDVQWNNRHHDPDIHKPVTNLSTFWPATEESEKKVLYALFHAKSAVSIYLRATPLRVAPDTEYFQNHSTNHLTLGLPLQRLQFQR